MMRLPEYRHYVNEYLFVESFHSLWLDCADNDRDNVSCLAGDVTSMPLLRRFPHIVRFST